MTGSAQPARRRRRRASSAAGPPGRTPVAGATDAAPVADDPTVPARSADASPKRGRRPRREHGTGDRGLRDLVGAGPSQLGVSGALRGRDVNRPDDDDLAAAERDLTIVRRNWTPTDESVRPPAP